VITLPWNFLLSNKYSEFTLSTGGRYNFAIVGPAYNGKHIPRIEKLIQPVNETAVSYWEDPSFIHLESWSPFSSFENFYHLFKLFIHNLLKLLLLIFRFSPVLIVLLFFVNFKNLFKEKFVTSLILASVVFSAGLLLLFVHQRFFIIVHIVTVLFTFKLIENISDRFNLKNYLKKLLVYFVLFTVIVQPLYWLISRADYGKDVFTLSESLKKFGLENTNIASMSKKPLDDDWGSSLTLCYLLKAKYFGEASSSANESYLYLELKKFEISFLITWDMQEIPHNDNFIEIYRTDIMMSNSLLINHKAREIIIYKIL
jgi:hypothetical protein